MGGKNIFTGFSCAALGMLCSTVGMSSLAGSPRYTFGSTKMLKGLGMGASSTWRLQVSSVRQKR